MERLVPALVRHVLGRKTGDLERPFVHRKALAFGGIGSDKHRNVVDRSLHFTLGFERLLLGLFSILDVRDCPVPGDHVAGIIAHRGRPKQEPAILAVETPQARLAINWNSAGYILIPGFYELVEVIGVNT